MADIEASLSENNHEASSDSSPVSKLKTSRPADRGRRHVTPRKQRLPTMDRLSSSNFKAEDQLEVGHLFMIFVKRFQHNCMF